MGKSKIVSIEEVQDVIDELEEYVELRIRAEERYEAEMRNLQELECSSVEEARNVIKMLEEKIEKKNKDFRKALEEFKEDYGDLLNGRT